MYVAMVSGWPMPLAAMDAAAIVDMDCQLTATELDAMPQDLVDTVLLYKAVRRAIRERLVLRL